LGRGLARKDAEPRPEEVVEENAIEEEPLPAEEEPTVSVKTEELSFEPTSDVDEKVHNDDGEAEDVHS